MIWGFIESNECFIAPVIKPYSIYFLCSVLKLIHLAIICLFIKAFLIFH